MSPRPLEMLQRMADGDFCDEVQSWMRRAAKLYLEGLGSASLHECAQLPRSPHKMRLLQRDDWLLRAAVQLRDQEQVQGDRALANVLSLRLERFLSAGPWRFWRKLRTLPQSVDALDAALYHIALCNGGRALTSERITQILVKQQRDEVCRGQGHHARSPHREKPLTNPPSTCLPLDFRVHAIDALELELDQPEHADLFAAARADERISVVWLSWQVCQREHGKLFDPRGGAGALADAMHVLQLDHRMDAISRIETRALAIHHETVGANGRALSMGFGVSTRA